MVAGLGEMNVGVAGLEPVVSSPHLDTLRALHLSGCNLRGMAGARLLTNPRGLNA